MKRLLGCLAASLVLCMAMAMPSFANSCSGGKNLISNCGFSNGTTGWTTSGFTQYDSVGSGALVGSTYALALGNFGTSGLATISQGFTDTAGVLYTLSFSLYNGAVGNNVNFLASIDGTTVLNSVNTLIQPYQVYSFTFTGTGSDTISFSAVNDPSYYYLSNVSVRESGAVTTPEPTSILFVGTGLASLLAVRRKKAQGVRQQN